MKLIPKKWQYELPQPIGFIKSASICHDFYHNMIEGVAPCFFVEFDENTEGEPKYFCITENTISFHPTPDKEYDVRIQFYPPIQEL